MICAYNRLYDWQLTFLSGGVRGIVQLTMLDALEKKIDLGIPVQDFFDLIVGTRYVPKTPTIITCNTSN